VPEQKSRAEDQETKTGRENQVRGVRQIPADDGIGGEIGVDENGQRIPDRE
jgi:hypothetical protein